MVDAVDVIIRQSPKMLAVLASARAVTLCNLHATTPSQPPTGMSAPDKEAADAARVDRINRLLETREQQRRVAAERRQKWTEQAAAKLATSKANKAADAKHAEQARDLALEVGVRCIRFIRLFMRSPQLLSKTNTTSCSQDLNL
jgi:hypothetical protein